MVSLPVLFGRRCKSAAERLSRSTSILVALLRSVAQASRWNSPQFTYSLRLTMPVSLRGTSTGQAEDRVSPEFVSADAWRNQLRTGGQIGLAMHWPALEVAFGLSD